jgi:hypothetical protein
MSSIEEQVMFERGQAKRRGIRAGAVAACAVVVLGACGGGSSGTKPASLTSASTTTAPNSNGSGSGGGGSDCPSAKVHARVRFVNLYTNSTYPKGDIEIWQGYTRTGCSKRLATIGFGKASDFVDVTANDDQGNWEATAFVPGGSDDDHQIIQQSETWKGGEQVTMLLFAQEPTSGNPASFGSDQVLFEKDPSQETTITTAPGKATIVASGVAVQAAVPDANWRLGVPRAGCLSSTDDTPNSTTSVGGTSALQFAVDPGPIDVALYPIDPGTCAGTPAVGPVSIDAQEGSRTLVLAYGTDKQSLALLVLPFAS